MCGQGDDQNVYDWPRQPTATEATERRKCPAHSGSGVDVGTFSESASRSCLARIQPSTSWARLSSMSLLCRRAFVCSSPSRGHSSHSIAMSIWTCGSD